MSDDNKTEIPPLPYLNTEFMNSPGARPLRILSEYLEPAERLRRARIRDTIVFFGSARSVSPEEAERRMTKIREEIEQASALTPTLEAELARTEYIVRMSRYYGDA